ncbi:Conserved_hypothetical protein [Hexamita inflata]|uniref:Transmembrane protein n=1 Tax=Hexamita inflata TaxID=28002 RepID=A0AA86RBM1_9EUKA|nr:Conserved hypothetical protein [Hexamita inflata]
MERIKMYQYTVEVYQLHYFSYSTSNNWEEIMTEQQKAQPNGLSEKYRVSSINGNLAVTKSLNIQAKSIDGKSTINGFLTIVLNQPFNYPVSKPYILVDENMRYLSGLTDTRYLKGIKQVLYSFKYIKNIQVNYSLSNILNILELDNTFWNDALIRAENEEFTLIATQNQSNFQNYLSEADYNKSEIHQRTIIFDATCDYINSGKIMVKQLGAIDGILIIFEDVTLSNFNEDLIIVDNNFLAIEKLAYYYNDLNNRNQSTTYYTRTIFPFNYSNTITFQLTVSENTVILYSMATPVILLVFLIIWFQNRQHKIINYIFEVDDFPNITSSSIQSGSNVIVNAEDNYYFQQQIKCNQLIRKQNRIKIEYFQVLFSSDYRKYANLSLIPLHTSVFHFILLQASNELNHLSFQILVPAQQYSLLVNSIVQRKSYLRDLYLKFNGDLQINSNSSQIKVVSKNKSKQGSQIVSQIISKRQSFENISLEYKGVFESMNEFYDRKDSTPNTIQIISFSKKEFKFERITELVQNSIE